MGASRELRAALNELDHDKIRGELQRHDCDWFVFKMNVPSASHMGGVWERQIRSVRNVLATLLQANGSELNEEALSTFMCEAEAIVNSRPLTIDSLNDPTSLNPLTPNHLLTMKTKVLLPPPCVFQSSDMYCKKRWRRVQPTNSGEDGRKSTCSICSKDRNGVSPDETFALVTLSLLKMV